jgi:hypothetical protein
MPRRAQDHYAQAWRDATRTQVRVYLAAHPEAGIYEAVTDVYRERPDELVREPWRDPWVRHYGVPREARDALRDLMTET